MKRLGISQRVAVIEAYNERRDCLDQRWSAFAEALDYMPLPLPNIVIPQLGGMLDSLALDAVLLSGGNSIALPGHSIAGVAPERDAFERELIAHALKKGLPLLGVCRGAQMLNLYFGGALSPISAHVACRHPLQAKIDGLPASVNSYHDWGIQVEDLADDLEVLACADDGSIEAFRHRTIKSVAGLMWHPERESPFMTEDITFIKELFS